MRRSITAALAALVVLGGLIVPARGETISGTLEGDATLTTTGTAGVYIQNFTGDGDDTIFGAFTPQSQSNVDFTKPPHILFSDGMFTETFAQGTLFGTSSGSGTASGQGTATVTLDFLFTGGTGLFAGATGEATLTATITTTSATTESISNGSYTGSLSFVPEPSSLALLAPALVVGAVVMVRRRERMAIAP